MKKINWTTVRLVLMVTLVIFLYSFASNRNNAKKLIKSEVIFSNPEELFVDSETVNKLLIENKSEVKSIAKDEVDLNTVEKTINNHKMIEKSEVFVSIDGVLKVIVKQKTPIARVYNQETSFYIDYQGNKMPLSNITTARVPLVLGEINEETRSSFTDLLKKIYEDEFLKKNIIGIQILPNNELIMKNRNYNYEIEFGKVIGVDEKLKKYKAFFQKESAENALEKYKKINLKFAQQVVCIK